MYIFSILSLGDYGMFSHSKYLLIFYSFKMFWDRVVLMDLNTLMSMFLIFKSGWTGSGFKVIHKPVYTKSGSTVQRKFPYLKRRTIHHGAHTVVIVH